MQRHLSDIFDHGLLPDLPVNHRLVLLFFAHYADENGQSFPTQRHIAERCGLTIAEVRAAIAGLVRCELLSEGRHGNRKTYQLAG